MNRKNVSFILPTRNVEKYIENLLTSIYSQEYDGQIEVLIMDSSNDKTRQIVQKFPVKIVDVNPEDYNYGKTRNEGAAMTNGELLIFLSTDVEIKDKKWLLKLTRHFSDSNVAGVFGRQIPKNNAQPMEQFFIGQIYPDVSSIISCHDGIIHETDVNGIDLKKHVVIFSNVNSAIRRSVWEQVKLPEMLKSEEIEWAKRVLIAGHKIIYDSESAVFHSHRYSLKQVFQEYFDSGALLPVVYINTTINYHATDFIKDGLIFVNKEYKFMFCNGYWYWIPYAICYDIAKSLGFLLGANQKCMPIWMKKALCKKKNHWDKYTDVIHEST